MLQRLCLLFLMLGTLFVISDAVAAPDNKRLFDQAAVLQGELLFQKKCAVCHGNEGIGGVGVPLNLNDFLTTTSDRYLYQTIRLGRPGRVMPSFQSLSDEQIQAVIRYIRSWKAGIQAPEYPLAAITGDPAKGGVLYQSHCSECHSDNGMGGEGTGVTFSRPRDAEIIAPAIGHPAFLASASDQMIKHIIMTGRQSTPMKSAQSMGLKDEDVNDIISYLHSLAGVNKKNRTKLSQSHQQVLTFESSYSLEETIENIKQASLGYNFRYIREQTLDHGFVDKKLESTEQYLVYFCNFTFLNQALSEDPRIGMFLPFRATIVKQSDSVLVMAVNPQYLCALFNNDELQKSCEFMTEKYKAILEESTL